MPVRYVLNAEKLAPRTSVLWSSGPQLRDVGNELTYRRGTPSWFSPRASTSTNSYLMERAGDRMPATAARWAIYHNSVIELGAAR